MSEAEKYRLELLKCERTFENLDKIIKSLKAAKSKDIYKLLQGIEIDFDKIRDSIINTLEP